MVCCPASAIRAQLLPFERSNERQIVATSCMLVNENANNNQPHLHLPSIPFIWIASSSCWSRTCRFDRVCAKFCFLARERPQGIFEGWQWVATVSGAACRGDGRKHLRAALNG